MAPELAIVYGAGLIPSTIVSLLHYRSYRIKMKSPEFQNLQANLKKINKFWAEYAGEIRSLDESDPQSDFKNFQKGLFIASYFFIAMSWAGFFFHSILFWSLRTLARPRIERRLFSSPLASENLDIQTIEKILTDLH